MHPTDGGMLLQELRDLQRVLAVALHAQRKRLQTLKQQERVEGADTAACVAHCLHTRFHREGEIAKSFIETYTMVTWRRIDDMRELAIVPGELARLDQHARDRGAMPADELGRGMHDNVASILKRTAQARSSEGTIDHQWDTGLDVNICHRSYVEHIAARAPDGIPV